MPKNKEFAQDVKDVYIVTYKWEKVIAYRAVYCAVSKKELLRGVYMGSLKKKIEKNGWNIVEKGD